jgi:hypothetical protein
MPNIGKRAINPMKYYQLFLITLASFLGTTTSVSAQPYMFTYSKLYSQMKHNVEVGHEDVKVGFFFVNAETKALCTIEKAWMENEKHSEALVISPSYELIVPLDSNLKQVNPLILVDTQRDKRCDFSVVVMTKQPLSGKLTYQDIERLMPQMQSMLGALGGMFASWFTPDVEGLTLEFSASTQGELILSNGKQIPLENGKARIRLTDLKPGEYVTLPAQTTRALPWLPSAK